MKKKKNKLIVVGLVSSNKVKSQYKPKTKKLTGMLEIYENKNYGAVGTIYYTNSFFGRLREKITKKEQKKYSKRLKKAFDSDKRVDTSKWVKPDEESIRQELIKNLFLTEIFDEESKFYIEAQAKVDVCYSILHSHSPKNPQGLTNYAFDGFPFTVITELNGKYKDKNGMFLY